MARELEQHIAAILASLFGDKGYQMLEPPILQPAGVFVDLSGEDIRRRMLVTQGPDGIDLCLRPEYTIPVARTYLSSEFEGQARGYSYAGPVFRRRAGETGEFLQAGIEMIGHDDVPASDAEILGLALNAFTELELPSPTIHMGDIALLETLLAQLKVPAHLQRRLMRAIVDGNGLQALHNASRPQHDKVSHNGLLAALEGQDPQAARALIEDLLSIAGITPIGGRSVADIADRFLNKAAQKDVSISPEVASVISQFLSIKGDPDTAAGEIRYLARNANLDLEDAIDTFESRCGFMALKGIDIGTIQYAGNFARNLNYYTGFVFELHSQNREDGKPLGGGGRYDRLLSALGAKHPLSAVGCSLWIDRLADEVDTLSDLSEVASASLSNSA
jgi:ATP phosphoribosyltransferase regulatory subunit